MLYNQLIAQVFVSLKFNLRLEKLYIVVLKIKQHNKD